MSCLRHVFLQAFTTPPFTRKRKAVEAAIIDGDEKITGDAAAASPIEDTTPSPTKTSLSTSSTARKDTDVVYKKRRGTTNAAESTDNFPVSLRKRVTDIATPATTTADSMDSDDDFMSDASSQEDFLGTQGSDDESIGEGE